MVTWIACHPPLLAFVLPVRLQVNGSGGYGERKVEWEPVDDLFLEFLWNLFEEFTVL